MTQVTQILSAVEQGDPHAAEQLIPLVYDELRKLAAVRMAAEMPGHTLQATALVHEAYLRLVGDCQPRAWDGRGHFFAAAAEAMRRILVDDARRRQSRKRGGEMHPMDRNTFFDRIRRIPGVAEGWGHKTRNFKGLALCAGVDATGATPEID